MAAALQGDAAPPRVVRDDLRRLSRRCAEAVLHDERTTGPARVVDVKGELASLERRDHGWSPMPASSAAWRRKVATPGASLAASPWAMSGPSKPARFRQDR